MGFEYAELGSIGLGGHTGLVDGPFGSNLPASSYLSEGIPVIRGSNLSKGEVRFRDDEFAFVSSTLADKLARSTCVPKDIVFTKKGTLGQVGIVPNVPFSRYLLSSNQMRLRVDPTLANPEFIYYALSTKEAIERLIRGSEHTGVPKINLAYIRQFEIPLPPLPVQNAIAKTVTAFDVRIDLLRQTNATLEAIAQALFKSWFVAFDPVRAKAEGREPEGMDATTAALFPSEFEDSEFGPIPKGWSVEGLGKISKNVREQAKPESLDPSTPYIGLDHMPKKSIALTTQGTAEGLASGKFWYRASDILFGKLRPYFHKVGVAIGAGVCSTDILVVRPVSPEWLGYTAMQFSSDAIISYATQLSNGAKMPRTNWADLAKFRVALPPENAAEAFDNIVRPLISKIHANIVTADTLGRVRDSLLPRLISGRLRLLGAESECGEA